MAEVLIPCQSFVPQSMDHSSVLTLRSTVPAKEVDQSAEVAHEFRGQDSKEIFDCASSLGSSHSPSLENGIRRPNARVRPQRLSFNALPAFNFNPSGEIDPTNGPFNTSPTKTMTPPHSSVHRRNGSEFIGGDSDAVLKRSPTKGENQAASTAAYTNGPTVDRRGHSHRRSGAVSSHDLSHLSKPSVEAKINSLPVTPSSPNDRFRFPSRLDRSYSQPETSSTPSRCLQSESDDYTMTDKQPRSRVGFSDTLEFIPRPLSTISSETTSSMSTIRAGHSVTDSITSIVAADSASSRHGSPDRALDALTLQSLPSEDSYPAQPLSQIKASLDRPPQVTKSMHKSDIWSSTSAHAFTHDNPAKSQETDHVNTDAAGVFQANEDAPPASLRLTAMIDCEKPKTRSSKTVRPQSSPQAMSAKLPEKTKSWTDSFLARKPREHGSNFNSGGHVGCTGSSAPFASPDSLSLEHLTFDEDTTCVIRDASLIPASPSHGSDKTHNSAHAIGSFDQDVAVESMLDLDAAFAMSSSPSSTSNFNEINEGGFLAARRRMHSSGATGRFSGPRIHYHRRAESAPEMAPIDFHNLGFPRWGSNPKMADVFEEEEEDNDAHGAEYEHKADLVPPQSKSAPSVNLNSQELEDTSSRHKGDATDVPNTQDQSSPRNLDGTHESVQLVSESQFLGLQRGFALDAQYSDTVVHRESLINIVRSEEEPRASTLRKRPYDHSATSTILTMPNSSRPVSAPFSFALPNESLTSMPPDTPSTATSPDFARTSFDVPRLYTANSSITDRMTLSSHRAGEHGIIIRSSVDDVPSLTSSASTMTNAQHSRASGSVYSRHSVERSSMLPNTTRMNVSPSTSSKRSSLASLSRLVGHSHGERSKLYMEEHIQLEGVEKAAKKKGNRISRLMRFWKSKEKLTSP